MRLDSPLHEELPNVRIDSTFPSISPYPTFLSVSIPSRLLSLVKYFMSATGPDYRPCQPAGSGPASG